ncbi:hypothetical protein QYZ41_12035 [Vibrio parahaemolyticus]|nr:hypothetical protein [Vibrio parahaemolyticus]
MISIKDFKIKESKQSHSFVMFQQGSPYCMLGWQKYRLFNDKINDCLREFQRNFSVQVYLYEYEVVHVEGLFLWGVSFSHDNNYKRDELSELLICQLTSVFKKFFEIQGDLFLHSHSENFNNALTPDLMQIYVDMVMSFDEEIDLKYSPPREKSYEKDDFDISLLKQPIKVSKFKEMIDDYLRMNSTEDLVYRFSSDGYFSNKYRSNKYLREEFVPLLKFIRHKGFQIMLASSSEFRMRIMTQKLLMVKVN